MIGDEGEEVFCFQGNQRVWGPLGLILTVERPPHFPAPLQTCPRCPSVLMLGVECRLSVGSFERRAKEGTGCQQQHADWLFSSSVVDTQLVPGRQWWQGLCTSGPILGPPRGTKSVLRPSQKSASFCDMFEGSLEKPNPP